MRFMRWSWLDYCHTPVEVVNQVLAIMEDQALEEST